MAGRLPTIIVTGASGLVGRAFLDDIKDDFIIYGFARRSQQEVGVAEHPNIKWVQIDIANKSALDSIAQKIELQGPVDYILHLAGYYDFTYEDHPEYERTNVGGTRNMLEIARTLSVKRFIFASSLAACKFPSPGEKVTEDSPPDASFEYARSKKAGEEMLREYSKYFSCSTIRLAAVISDWCEYVPLYFLISTWLSENWNARILGGRGESAITYIHIRDLIKLLRIILKRSAELPSYAVYNASPDASTSHLELYELASRFFYGKVKSPFLIPKLLAWPGILARDLIGRMTGDRPFEKPWMVRYIDRKLMVDSSRTREALGWEPAPRDHVLRRVLFMIDKMTSQPVEYRTRNEAVIKRVAMRPNFAIYEELIAIKDELQKKVEKRLLLPHRKSKFAYFQTMSREDREQYVSVMYGLLMASIRTVNRSLMLSYIDECAPARFAGGATPEALRGFMFELNDVLLRKVESDSKLKELKQEAHNYITLTLQLAADQIEVAYEDFQKLDEEELARITCGEPSRSSSGDYVEIINELYAFYQLSPEDELSLEDIKQLCAYMAKKKIN